MSLTITINSIDRTSNIKMRSISISDNMNSRNTSKFNLIDEDNSLSFEVGQSVLIDDTGTTIFSGTISTWTRKMLAKNVQGMIYNVQCVDYNQLCDRFLAQEVYTSQSAGDIFNDLIDTYLADDNITHTAVETGVTIEKVIFPYITLSKCFNELATLTGYHWYIDYNKDMHFVARTDETSTTDLSDTDENIQEITEKEDSKKYRNIQYIRAGNEITTERTDKFKGNGKLKTFGCVFELAEEPVVVQVVSGITATYSVADIGILGLETGKKWYWQKGSKDVSQEDADTELSDTDTMNVIYKGLYPIQLQNREESEITSRQAIEGGSGIYENIVDDQSLETSDSAEQKSEGLLRKYANIPETLKITTRSKGFRSGQIVNVAHSTFGLNSDYLIQSVQYGEIGDGTFAYKLVCLSGEDLGSWVDFFGTIVASGQKYVIRENEVLIKVIQFSDTITVTDTFTISSSAPESRVGYAIVDFSEVGI